MEVFDEDNNFGEYDRSRRRTGIISTLATVSSVLSGLRMLYQRKGLLLIYIIL